MQRERGQAYPHLPLPEAGEPEDLGRFQRWLEAAIPLAGHIGLRRMCWQGDALVWDLQLQPNLNDKGSGFGGSLTAQSTLLGWTWTTLWLRARGRRQDVVVAEASQRFLSPVSSDYRLECAPREGDGTDQLDARLQARGKGRIALIQRLYVDDILCLEAEGNYAVLPAPSLG